MPHPPPAGSKDLAVQVVSQGGDYVWSVKANKERPVEYNQSTTAHASQKNKNEVEVSLADLAAAFAAVPDPRHPRNRTYTLSSLLLAVTTAILCNHLSILACAEWFADHCWLSA